MRPGEFRAIAVSLGIVAQVAAIVEERGDDAQLE